MEITDNTELQSEPEFKKKCGRLRRAIFHNHVYMLTTSVESGIMLPANPLVKYVISSALLKAQLHHQIKISHLLVNATHIHFLVRVINPQDIPDFMERFKTESAHYLNRLLGRKKRTIWCDRYDMSAALEASDVIDRIIYIYTNPVKDGLVSSIDLYPGLSSWNRFNSSKSYLKGSLISRRDIKPVEQVASEEHFERARKQLAVKKKLRTLVIDPNDWMKAFKITNKDEIEEINKTIKEGIIERTKVIHERRLEAGKKQFLGSHKLRNQEINLEYQSKRSGRKMWCYCRNIERRKQYISWVKELAAEAREVYRAWQSGDTSRAMPIGMFAPRMPVQGNLIFC